MTDPYEVLGVPRTATEDEIKAAYRRLAKQYHPDLHPGDEAAAGKMNEINAAYDAIKNPQPQYQYQPSGGGPSPFDFDPFGYAYREREAYQTRYEARDSAEIQTAMHYINNGAYAEALHVLSQIPREDRDGKWYYCSARANLGQGNRVAAMEHIRMAMRLEPENLNYQRLYQLLQSGSRVYTDAGERHGYSVGFGGSYCYPMCTALCLANLCCGGKYYWFCC